jgi:hypothetical protein
MPVEQRGQVIAIWVGSTGNGRSPTLNGRRQPSRGGTSRMTRECHVRICEGLGVKFPGPTRHVWTAPWQGLSDVFCSIGRVRSRVRPHMRALASSYFISTMLRFRRIGAIESIDQGGAPITTGLPCKPHIRRDRVPTTVPHSGRESSRRAAPLFETMRGIRPDNGDAPLDPSAPAVVRLGLSLSFRMD